MIKKLGIIISIILITVLTLTTSSFAVSDANGIYLGLRENSTKRETGKYTFNSKDVFKIVQYNNSTGSTLIDN